MHPQPGQLHVAPDTETASTSETDTMNEVKNDNVCCSCS